MKISRRTVLKTAAGALVFGTAPGLIAGMAHAQGPAPMALALTWIANVEYAGLWIALERGYFRVSELMMARQKLAPAAIAHFNGT